jgi:hypothetical protein
LSRSRTNPALTSIAFALGTLAAWCVLHTATGAGADTDDTFVETPQFQAWVAIAAIAAVAFVDTFLAGARELRDERLRGSRSTPESPGSSRSAVAYAGLYLLFAGIIVAILIAGGRGGPDVPVAYWRVVGPALLLLGVAGAGPWVVLVWASHSLLSQYRDQLANLPRPATSTYPEPGGDGRSTAAMDELMNGLFAIRGDIAATVGRLLVLITGAVLLSGALRTALVPDEMSATEFPAAAVLVYGAFFTVALSLAVIPLMLSWRRTAVQLVDHAYPRSVSATADHMAARDRLVTVLDLDGSLFRSPIAVSTIAAPLITSLLAVVIPELGT